MQHTPEDEDEELDEAALGEHIDEEDDLDDVDSEIDEAGAAAGIVTRDDRPFHGIEEVERRDARRWENNPDSRDVGLDE